MKHTIKQISLALLATAAIIGCKKDKEEDPITPPAPPNEEELITTLRLNFQSTGGTQQRRFEFVDLDGDGGNDPVVTADTLSADTIYMVEIEVLNESGSPVEDITAEIAGEAEEHQFFFQPGSVNASISYNDADANGDPIGLNTIWTIGAASSDSVRVTLRHEPNKAAAGVSAGDITNAGGETDISVMFPMVIE